MPKNGRQESKNHGKLLPRASDDARDAGHDAIAFRPRPRSDQRPLHEPVRLFDVGPCGVRLQASVAFAVRPQGAGRRGSSHGAKPARPVRRGAGAAAVSIRTRTCASVLTRSTRGPRAGASPGFTRPCGAAGFWTTGACTAIPHGGGRDWPSLLQEGQMQRPPRREPPGRREDVPSPDARGGDRASRPEGGAAARAGADPER